VRCGARVCGEAAGTVKVRPVVAAVAVVLAAFFAVPVAGAAVWQGPVAISDAASSAGDAPRMSLGASGDAAVAWWDSGTGGRVLLARRLAGGAWSAPVVIGASASAVTALSGVDGAGNVTAVWSDGAGSDTTVATWPAAAEAPSFAMLDQFSDETLSVEPAVITQLVVNRSGVAVVAGESGASNIALAYRATPTGPFAFSVKLGGGGGAAARDPHLAINDAGSAVVIYRQSDTIWSSRLSAAVPSFGPADAVDAGISGTSTPDYLSVAIDPAGNVLVAFTLFDAGAGRVLGTAWRPANGDWTVQWPLSPPGSPQGSAALNAVVVLNRAGTAFLAWLQAGDGTESIGTYIAGRVGSSSTGLWGATERVFVFGPASPHAWDAGLYRPRAAIGDDGTVVVAWDAYASAGQLVGMASTRAPATGWGAPQLIGPLHVAQAQPSIATDAAGHFATAASPESGGLKQVLVSFLDLVPPLVSPVVVAGTQLAGDPMSLSLTASDTWSAIAVSWDLGDGQSSTGSAVSHAYASAGTYVASAAVSDSAGNTTTVQVRIVISAKRSALTSARFKSTWKQSRVSGSLVVGGTVPRAGSYVIDATNGTTRAIHRVLQLGAGAFALATPLPRTLPPGRYHVTLEPPFPSAQVQPAAREVTLAAPASGVVDRSSLTRTRTRMRASFHFVAVPKGRLTVIWYLTSKGRRHRLATASRAAAVSVTSVLQLGSRRGLVTVVIARKGDVITARSMKVL
jgi:hypothetical protein